MPPSYLECTATMGITKRPQTGVWGLSSLKLLVANYLAIGGRGGGGGIRVNELFAARVEIISVVR